MLASYYVAWLEAKGHYLLGEKCVKLVNINKVFVHWKVNWQPNYRLGVLINIFNVPIFIKYQLIEVTKM